MTRAIELDFAVRRRALPPAGVTLLAAALLAAVLLGREYAGTRAEIEAVAERLDRLHAGEPRKARPRGDAQGLSDELQRVRAVLVSLETPWNELFAAIEAVPLDDVAVLGMRPDMARGEVRVDAEARDIAAAIAFTLALGRADGFQRAHMVSHEVQAQDPHRPVRFSVSAGWTGRRGTR